MKISEMYLIRKTDPDTNKTQAPISHLNSELRILVDMELVSHQKVDVN